MLARPEHDPLQAPKEREMRDPRDAKVADPNKAPDFGETVRTYKMASSTAGDVEARVYKSKDGAYEYTVLKDKEGRIWFKSVVDTSAGVNEFGVYNKAPDVGELVTPLWEYTSQIPHGYVGEVHAEQKKYASSWKYLRQMEYVKQFYEAHGLEMPDANGRSAQPGRGGQTA